jgi:hypothetical protein
MSRGGLVAWPRRHGWRGLELEPRDGLGPWARRRAIHDPSDPTVSRVIDDLAAGGQPVFDARAATAKSRWRRVFGSATRSGPVRARVWVQVIRSQASSTMGSAASRPMSSAVRAAPAGARLDDQCAASATRVCGHRYCIPVHARRGLPVGPGELTGGVSRHARRGRPARPAGPRAPAATAGAGPTMPRSARDRSGVRPSRTGRGLRAGPSCATGTRS